VAPLRPNEAQKRLWRLLTEKRTCPLCKREKVVCANVRYVPARRNAGFWFVCSECAP
jgi:transcription elongation factor Elf1